MYLGGTMISRPDGISGIVEERWKIVASFGQVHGGKEIVLSFPSRCYARKKWIRG